MNIATFTSQFSAFKDADQIQIECDHPQHEGGVVTIGKQPAKRNILKNGGKEFVCRKCMMKHNNPMTHIGESRQTDEIIDVVCPCEEHENEPIRQMKKSCYYGVMKLPYLQICGSCAQKGKIISDDQKEAIRIALTGITRSDDFKAKLSHYMKTNPEGIARGIKNLFENHCTTGMLGKHQSDEAKKKQSEAIKGRKYSDDHKNNISEGRKKMLEATGGFTTEHKEKISKAVIAAYQNGFDPQTHHVSGYHESLKAGQVFHRSSYEKKAYMKLDADETVLKYFVESVVVEYHHPIKQITSNYLIDIAIEYVDGKQAWVEIKPLVFLTTEVVSAKIDAALAISAEKGIPFLVWTEMDLFGHVYNEKNMRAFADKIKNGEI
jgi:hypothetical protein